MAATTPAEPPAVPLRGLERLPARLPVVLVWIASVAVLGLATLTSFRLGFADDAATLLRVNGPRVLFAATCGGALALAGTLRLRAGRVGALDELALFAVATGAAGGGFGAATLLGGAPALPAYAIGALAGAAGLVRLVRALDRPRRLTNLGAAAVLVAGIAAAAFAATYTRPWRGDPSDPGAGAALAGFTAWLLGDLSGATVTTGVVLLVALAALLGAAMGALRVDSRTPLGGIALLAFGAGVGAAGPLPFVGTLVPRAVRVLAPRASPRAFVLASVIAGAASVSAIDAVPRLLVGGYDFPFAVPAEMLAIPIFLGWNRARLRREVGGAGAAFEALELAVLGGLTLAGVFLAYTLANVIRTAT